MKLKPIGPNQTELTLSNGARVLFSYETPVAYIDNAGNAFKTNKKWSNTTSEHINKWIGPWFCQSEPQEKFDKLAEFDKSITFV